VGGETRALNAKKITRRAFGVRAAVMNRASERDVRVIAGRRARVDSSVVGLMGENG